MKAGFVTIVGRPNVGKSTLLNSIIGEKIAITSNVSGTTRNIIQGIYNDDNSQIIFIDTPGVHKPLHKLGSIMNNKVYDTIEQVDVILFVVDSNISFGKGDKFILDKIKDLNKPIILILNKIDKIKDKKLLLERIDEYNKIYNFNEIIPVSAVKNDIYDLIKTIKKFLNDQDRLYDEDFITLSSTRFLISELVREKLLNTMRDEIPHTITCYTEEYKEKKDIINTRVVIVVDRDNLKGMIIGKNGKNLKNIGTCARYDIEKLLNKKVYLETYVKVIKNWRDKEVFLKELGIYEDL